ncbi:hypothetical protein BJ322DRAFT_1112846 [Thelephora terrestris]|uniref:Uncharacterized protein n=1 Tax=Thelephora terrestris TaxID=56493 RepID=A0A9P6H601_9AGAM|nr:hypothetical protein BJ322DRAFT_1112846 [Thelephora terrestris]
MAWNIRGLENPSSDEFLNNPDLRQIAAFFLGWVFIYSVQIILSSPLLQEDFVRACFSFFSLVTNPIKRRHESNDVEAPTHAEPANAPRRSPRHNTAFNSSSDISRLKIQEDNALLITLALCFTCASVAHFASLLQYPTTGNVACAFVVAWGGTAAQAGRLTGLLILSLELKKLAVRRKEIYIFWVSLLILLGLTFANNAVAVGTLRPVPSLRISLCYRRHFAPTGLASSLALILAELYLVARFIFLISSKGLGWLSQLDLLGDSRMSRALSLLLLDVLTITSATKPTNLLVDFVPFAIGAMVVLFAFNSGSPKKEKETAPSLWSYYHETRRFALYPTPAPSVAPTLSIRRMSERTTHTTPLPNTHSSEHEPPPAPTRSALSLRVALRNFTTQEQENSRAVIDGHTMIRAESPTLSSPATVQSRTRSSVLRLFHIRSENPGTQSARQSLRNGKRPQMALFINPEKEVPHLPESSATSESGYYAADSLRMPTPRKRSNRTKRSSTSSGLTYMTPNSHKIIPSRRPSYLLSPSRSFQQSMASTPRTPIPTWEDMYRQLGLQFDPSTHLAPYALGSFHRVYRKITHAAPAWVDEVSADNSTFFIGQHSARGAKEGHKGTPTLSYDIEASKQSLRDGV